MVVIAGIFWWFEMNESERICTQVWYVMAYGFWFMLHKYIRRSYYIFVRMWCCKFAYTHICWANAAKNYRLLVLICVHYNFEWVFIFQFAYFSSLLPLQFAFASAIYAYTVRQAEKNSTKREIELNFIMIS